MSDFYNNFLFLCEQKDKTPTKAASEIGLSGAAVTGWKSGTIPHYSTIRKIADYFQVDPEALKNGKITPPRELQLSEEESRFLMVFRQIERKDLALSYLQALADSQKPPAVNDSPASDTAPAPEALPRKD